MKKLIILTLALAAASHTYAGGHNKSFKQPYPKHGFWVTESVPGIPYTLVKYYANSITLVFEEKVWGEVDITRRSIRKNLNDSLKKELAKESGIKFRELNLYQMKGEAER